MEGDNSKGDDRLYNAISIHSLRVEGNYRHTVITCSATISIHSLRVEGDCSFFYRISIKCFISIHSLRVEGDKDVKIILLAASDFNPLPPCGGRRPCQSYDLGQKVISIHSLRVEGDLRVYTLSEIGYGISIHSLRVEGDIFAAAPSPSSVSYFNPLPPCGGRQYRLTVSGGGKEFQSTPSVWRETDSEAAGIQQ